MDETIYKRSPIGKDLKEGKKKTISLKFKNKTLSVSRSVRIGRSPDNDIVLDKDNLVSRRHALIEISEKQATIRDLGSVNRTYVNGNPLKDDEVRKLKPGDSIKVGNTEF